MGSFSILHWIIVLVVVLLLFGPKRLPDLAKGLGEAIREFKKAVNTPEQPAPPPQIAHNPPPAQITHTTAPHIQDKGPQVVQTAHQDQTPKS